MRHVYRSLVGALAFALVASACGSGGGGGGASSAIDIAKQPASAVKPPSPLNTKRTGLPGLVIATASPALRRLTKAAEGKGALILFVEPGGPSDGLGIGRGDLITSVGGVEVTNHARALALLHDVPKMKIEVGIRHTDGRERTVTITPREPLVSSLRQYLNPLVSATPKDPVLRYVRASAPGAFRDRLLDLEEALSIDKRFVEAMSLRASLIWDNRPDAGAERARFVNSALGGWKDALAIDPENQLALTTRSTVLSVLGNGQQGRRDALKAIEVDNSSPRAYYAQAVAEEALNRPQNGLGPARAAVELDPFTIHHWRLLARTFNALKRKGDCRTTVNGFAPFLVAQDLEGHAEVLRSLCN